MSFQDVVHQITNIAVLLLSFTIWLWLAYHFMKVIPRITDKVGIGETPGLVVVIFGLWPLFAFTYQLCRHFLPS